MGESINSGDVVLAYVQFTDFGLKVRPAVVLFEEFGNIVVAGITSNRNMKGIPLTKDEGAIQDSVIKVNYIFTIAENMVKKKLFTLSGEKKNKVYKLLTKKIEVLNS